MRLFGWLAFAAGLIMILTSLLLPTLYAPSGIELTTAQLSDALGEGQHAADLAASAARVRQTASILLMCGIGATVVGAIFAAAGQVAARLRPRD